MLSRSSQMGFLDSNEERMKFFKLDKTDISLIIKKEVCRKWRLKESEFKKKEKQ